MQPRSEETRNRIIETASRLFSTNGYNATGVAEICQVAEVSKGAFYHHFPSKQALFIAVMENWLERLERGFTLTRHEIKNIPQALFQMAENAGEIFQTADVSMYIFLEFWVQAFRDPVIWQAAIAPYRHYQDYFASMIQEGVDQGTIRLVEPHQASRTLVALSLGLLMQALFDNQSTDWQKEACESVGLIMHGLKRQNS